jgi:hypothetical protein
MSATMFHIVNFVAMAAGIYICCKACLRSKRWGYLLVVLYLALSSVSLSLSVIQSQKLRESIRTSYPIPVGSVRATVREAHCPPLSILLVAGLFLIARRQESSNNKRIEDN